MTRTCNWFWRIGACGALFVLLAVPAAATRDVATNGADMWITAGGGGTFTTFAQDPIPADFFCPGSKPFTGTVQLKGQPLATEPEGALGSIDTILRRLDDAEFDEKGEAWTRLKMLALSLTGEEPFVTECGSYRFDVRLQGEQSTTRMKIVRTSKDGGTFEAPLSIRARVTFTPLDGRGEVRTLDREVNLGPAEHEVWSFVADPKYVDYVKVDTDANGKADTFVPMNSNFQAGVGALPASSQLNAAPYDDVALPACPVGYTPYQTCHCSLTSTNPYEPNGTCVHLHCKWVCVRTFVSTTPSLQN